MKEGERPPTAAAAVVERKMLYLGEGGRGREGGLG
jgi:hypothetical protein